jgi:hypothetical protein
MQTQTNPSTETKPAPLAQQIARAAAEQEKLHGVTADAAAHAKRWSIAWDHEATLEARDNRDLWAQREIIARAAAERHDRETLQPLLARQRQQERDAITAELDREEQAIREVFNAALARVLDGARGLDHALARLQSFHVQRTAAQQKSVPLQPVSLAEICSALNEHLAELRGTASELPAKHAALEFIDDGRDARVALTIHRPASAVPTTLR